MTVNTHLAIAQQQQVVEREEHLAGWLVNCHDNSLVLCLCDGPHSSHQTECCAVVKTRGWFLFEKERCLYSSHKHYMHNYPQVPDRKVNLKKKTEKKKQIKELQAC